MAQGFDQQDKTQSSLHHGSGSGSGPGTGPDQPKPGSSSEFDLDLGELGIEDPASSQPSAGAPSSGGKQQSVIKLADDPFPGVAPASQSGSQKKKSSGVLKLAGEDDLPPSGNLETEELTEGDLAGGDLQHTVGLDVGNIDLGPAKQTPAAGGSDVRLDLETGSFEFDLKVDSSGRLNAIEDPAPKSAPPAPPPEASGPKKTVTTPAATPTQVAAGGDDEVILDFDSSTIDDSMLLVGGGGLKPDSDVRIEPVSMTRPPSGPSVAPPPDDMMRTEEIDLDAELQKAAEASLKRKSTSAPKSQVQTQPKLAKTQLPGPKIQTQLPPAATSPFELTEEDLQLPTGSRRSTSGGSQAGAVGIGSGSEFELTLAPEDSASGSPLALGDDEDIDLGGAPKGDGGAPSSRAELSGINLGRPADSGVSLEKGSPSSSDKIDFELTLDDDATGPKTIRGKISDSDSEFELTIDDSGPLTAKPEDIAAAAAGDQKDIFETDFDVPSVEESGSQAVALDDTDLESSDFDLALEDSGSQLSTDDESASQVVPLDEESTDAAPRKKSRVSKVSSDSEIGDVDSMFDEDLMAPEPEPEPVAEDEDEIEAATVPAAQADWGIWPVILMAPCVLAMIMAGLMAYELLHGMWGYHSPSSAGGFLVKELSQLFTGDQAKE